MARKTTANTPGGTARRRSSNEKRPRSRGHRNEGRYGPKAARPALRILYHILLLTTRQRRMFFEDFFTAPEWD